MELAGLSFLGLGVKPPMAEWGSMINDGRSMLQTAPWVILAPGLAIFLQGPKCFRELMPGFSRFLMPKSKRKLIFYLAGIYYNGYR